MTNSKDIIKFQFCRKLGTYYTNADLLYYFSFFQKSWRYEKLSKLKDPELECQIQIDMWVGTELKALVVDGSAALKNFTTEQLVAELKKRSF